VSILHVPVTFANIAEWVRRAAQAINQLITRAPTLQEYTVATLPDAGGDFRLIYVSDEAGGAIPAFNDGTDWRRVTDRAVVS
jgi:predicted Rdx family selenoprotein